MGKRQSLKNFSPEQKAARKRQQATDRKRRQRARNEAQPIAMSPELEQFFVELLDHGLSSVIWGLALWERDNKQRFPDLDEPTPDASQEQLQLFKKRKMMLGLARFYVSSAIKRDSEKKRRTRFLVKEAEEADARGLSVEQFRNHKRLKRKVSAERQCQQDQLQTIQKVRASGAEAL